jgi:LysR family transcriptional regulator, glycine cleavage system transcriptional activator
LRFVSEAFEVSLSAAFPQRIVSRADDSFSYDQTRPYRIANPPKVARPVYASLACLGPRKKDMARRLPPLNTLRAFDAAARHESFTRAAEELCVTQAAVSQQVKVLEASLGLKLFHRDRKRLVTTDAGRAYLGVVGDALDRIATGTDRLKGGRSSNVLTISASPDFTAKWLVPRLGRFAKAHPEFDLRVSSAVEHIDFAEAGVDLAIRHGNGHWAGLDAVRLCSERLFPVCSPKLISDRNPIRQLSDVLKFPLLRLDGWTTWTQWFEAAGLSPPTLRGPVINQASMLIDAAVDGQGIALARTALASGDLLKGRLVSPFDISLRMPKTYWVACPKIIAREPKIMTFRDWMLTEATEDARRLKLLAAKRAKAMHKS